MKEERANGGFSSSGGNLVSGRHVVLYWKESQEHVLTRRLREKRTSPSVKIWASPISKKHKTDGIEKRSYWYFYTSGREKITPAEKGKVPAESPRWRPVFSSLVELKL